MTVQELIDRLQKEDPKAQVTADISPISGEDRVIEHVTTEDGRVVLLWD